MNEIETARWELPEPLRITPAMMEQIAEQQAAWKKRVQSPHASLTPQEMMRARALTLVDELIDALAVVTDPHARRVLHERLAEASATQGRFDLAAESAPTEVLYREYQSIWEAELRDDDQWCEHPMVGRIAPVFVKQEVWSIRHGAVTPLLKCNACGFTNVRPLTPQLAEQRRLRQVARNLVDGKSPQEARTILLSQGHTADSLSRAR